MDVKQQSAIRSPTASPSLEEAPPKQVATAMERLSDAAKLISDIRMGADRLLEALFTAANPHQANKSLELFRKEDSTIKQNLIDLRSIGRQLEESGVLNESMRSRSNSWGLHLPVVCPDGAAVAYAWKRQLAGQAGASAVDRTRLALKAFGDQKRRFFPHLDDDQGNEPAPKRHCSPQEVTNEEDFEEFKTVVKVVERVKKEVPTIKIMIHERLGWLRRSSTLSETDNEVSSETPKEHSYGSFGKSRTGIRDDAYSEKISVVELLVPSVFRCVVSLHPAGSVDPDAVAFFSPDESGRHVHARGSSSHNIYRHITEHAGVALQQFLGVKHDSVLYTLLHWICCYAKLFSQVCSKCGRLLGMDQKLSVLLPPVYRSYRSFSPRISSAASPTAKDRSLSAPAAYHIGCFQ